MYCNKCGKQIVDDSVYCSYCGVKIESHQSEQQEPNMDSLIIAACKSCIEKNLKAPATVQYPTIEIRDKDDYGRVYLYVEADSQNGFGAYIRTKFHVVLQAVHEDGTYEALNEAVYRVSFFATEDVVKSVNKWDKPKK